MVGSIVVYSLNGAHSFTMPIIGVKRANSELDQQSPVKKSSSAPGGLWTRITGIFSTLMSYLHKTDNDAVTQTITSNNTSTLKLAKRQSADDAIIVPPCTRPLHTPVLSELERNEKCCSTTSTTVRQPQSLLFTPVLLSNSSRHHQESLFTSPPGNKRLVSSTNMSSNHHYSKVSRPVLASSRFAAKDRSIITINDQSTSVDQSRYQSISTNQSRSLDQSRLRNQSTLTSHSRSKELSMSSNSPIFPSLNSPLLTAEGHMGGSNHVRITPQHSTPVSTSHAPITGSPIEELHQWINDFKHSYHSNRRDVTAQIDAAEKYARLQLDQRNQMCDQRMEQLRKRFDSGLDITELLMDDKMEEQQTEMRLQHDSREQALIQKSFGSGPTDEELSCAFRIRLKRRDFQTLYGLNWLNDEVVNFYMSLIAGTCSDVHSYSSFFYPKLISNAGYNGVRRWTKKVDIFSKRLLLIPVHLGMHWCLAAVDFSNKRISYYDSFKGHNPECLQALKQYLVQEAADKKQMVYDMSGWHCITHKNIPAQQNGSDCGVFMCMYARHLARSKPFSFSQDDMPIIREHMVLEMLEQKLI